MEENVFHQLRDLSITIRLIIPLEDLTKDRSKNVPNEVDSYMAKAWSDLNQFDKP